jgi:hypothetical protein
MAQQHTTKRNLSKAKRQVQIATVETVSDIFAAYVKRWTREEIQRLIDNNELPIVPIKDGLQVGRQRVKQQNSHWALVNQYNETVCSFVNKKSATLYSLLYQSRRYKSADEILGKDQKVSKLESNFRHYEASMRNAAKRKDYTTLDIVASRYYDTKIVLELARNDLEKTLRMNKYLKVWETGKPL